MLGAAVVFCLAAADPFYAVVATLGVITGIVGHSVVRLFNPWPGIKKIVRDLLLGIPAAVAFMFLVLLVLILSDTFLWRLDDVIWLTPVCLLTIIIWFWRDSKEALRIILAMMLWSLPIASSFFFASRIGAPRSVVVNYTGMGEYKAPNWELTHEIDFSTNVPGVVDDLPHGIAHKSVRNLLNSCGWVEPVQSHFVKRTTQRIEVRWFPVTTPNVLLFPEMSCKDLFFRASEDSRFVVKVPHYAIAKVYPEAITHDETVVDDMDSFVLPIRFGWNLAPTVQLEVIAPFMRNWVGAKLLSGALWEPLKWVVLAFCAIFGEQIKKGVLIPITKSIFKSFHIRFIEKRERNGLKSR
jgi:hypothetical protein